MKNFCKFLREHSIKIINSEKKRLILLINGLKESKEKEKICYICKNNLNINKPLIKSMVKKRPLSHYW